MTFSIKPGKGAKELFLEMNRAEVVEVLGEPPVVRPLPHGERLSYPDRDITVILRDGKTHKLWFGEKSDSTCGPLRLLMAPNELPEKFTGVAEVRESDDEICYDVAGLTAFLFPDETGGDIRLRGFLVMPRTTEGDEAEPVVRELPDRPTAVVNPGFDDDFDVVPTMPPPLPPPPPPSSSSGADSAGLATEISDASLVAPPMESADEPPALPPPPPPSAATNPIADADADANDGDGFDETEDDDEVAAPIRATEAMGTAPTSNDADADVVEAGDGEKQPAPNEIVPPPPPPPPPTANEAAARAAALVGLRTADAPAEPEADDRRPIPKGGDLPINYLFVVTPGHGDDRLHLEQTRDDVTQQLGEPSGTRSALMRFAGRGVEVRYDAQGCVLAITWCNDKSSLFIGPVRPAYVEFRGLRLGDSSAKIREVAPDAAKEDDFESSTGKYSLPGLEIHHTRGEVVQFTVYSATGRPTVLDD